jgi:hypothetical protein
VRLKRVFNGAVKLGAIIAASAASLILGSFAVKGVLKAEAKQAWATQFPANPRPADGNAGFDAFRHAYTSARLTQCFGAVAAKLMMDGNEVLDPNALPERRKDNYNNDVGARIWGQEKFSSFQKADATLAVQIHGAMRAGVLKTDPAAVPANYKHKSYFSLIGF